MYTYFVMVFVMVSKPAHSKKEDLHSLDFVVNRFCIKLFKTDNKEVIKACQEYFCFRLPSYLIETKRKKFNSIYNNHSNLLCRYFNRGKS